MCKRFCFFMRGDNMRKTCTSKERLVELMDYYEINQTELCRRTGIQKSALSNYLKGDREPRQDQISLIVDPFNVNPAWFMGYDVPMFIERAPSGSTPAASSDLRKDESELLSLYNSLNAAGKKEVRNHMNYILSQNKYKKDSSEGADSAC